MNHRPAPLAAPQMAFVRAWAEGLDATAAWQRYLGDGAAAGSGTADARQARAELQRLLDVLRGLARAHERPDIAVLLRRDPQAMPDASGPAVSFDDFIAQQPADFYSEAELVALYERTHGGLDARSPGRRRQRLRVRLLAALQWLQRQAMRAPQADDPVAAWLDERVAARLAAAGLKRLGDLHRQVCASGFHWHRHVPRLGPRGAARIVDWLQTQASGLGPLPPQVLRPPCAWDRGAMAPAAALGIVPLERLALPGPLDGHQGSNRGTTAGAGPGDRRQAGLDRAMGPAMDPVADPVTGPGMGPEPRPDARLLAGERTDLAAVQAWLARWPTGSHTWRAYRREAERLLLWAVLVRGKPLSSLDGGDCAGYRVFLQCPGAAWCAPRHTQRWSTAWRPFEAGLSARSVDTGLDIVRALFGWLVQQGHLASDPWTAAGSVVRADARRRPPVRALTPDQGQWLEAWLATQASSPAAFRLNCAVRLAADAGLRLSELCAARTDWLRPMRGVDGRWAWHLCIPGRAGSGPAQGVGPRPKLGLPMGLPMGPALCHAVAQHLVSRSGNPVATGLAAMAASALRAPPEAPAAGPGPGRGASAGTGSEAGSATARPCPALEPEAVAVAVARPGNVLPPGLPLIGRLVDGAPLGAARLYAVLRAGLARCAAVPGSDRLTAGPREAERGQRSKPAMGRQTLHPAQRRPGVIEGRARGVTALPLAHAPADGEAAPADQVGQADTALASLARASSGWLRAAHRARAGVPAQTAPGRLSLPPGAGPSAPRQPAPRPGSGRHPA